MKPPNCPVCEGQTELYDYSKNLYHCYFCGTTFRHKPEPWSWSRYERTHWVNPDGHKLYIGYFVQFDGPKGYVEAEVKFWAKRPIVALRSICKSGKDPIEFAGQVVN
jgi:hypothetical protein